MRMKSLRLLNPCSDGLAYAESHNSLQEAWDKCERGDWMLWLLGNLAGKPASASRKKLVLAACACARLSLKYIPDGESRPLRAIETAESWANGKATLQSVKIAAYAASAASAAYAAYAAYAASAAYAAAYAASAAYAAASAAAAYAAYAAAADSSAARKQTLRDCADIVRKMYPKAPRLRAKGEEK